MFAPLVGPKSTSSKLGGVHTPVILALVRLRQEYGKATLGYMWFPVSITKTNKKLETKQKKESVSSNLADPNMAPIREQ